MKNRLLLFTLVTAATFCITPRLMAIVDFEINAARGMPEDNEVVGLDDKFFDSGVSVSFGFDTTGDGITDAPAYFEKTGSQRATGSDPPFGFAPMDSPAAGFESQLGQFFLRSDTEGGLSDFGVFIVKYDPMDILITGARGEIWDIDGNPGANEQFEVKAFDSGMNLLDTILSPLGDNQDLNRRPWTFEFSGLNAGIEKITIDFVGTKEDRIGLAFNNFLPRLPTPEPTAAILALLGLLPLAVYREPRARRATRT